MEQEDRLCFKNVGAQESRFYLTPDLTKLRFPDLGFSVAFATETLTPEAAIKASA